MERQPHNPNDEHEQRPLPAPVDHEAGEGAAQPTIGIEFGSLSLTPPEGGPWGEWVIVRGIEAAHREGRPIDHRTAHYIADSLSSDSTLALRYFVSTGAIYPPALEELVEGFSGQAEHAEWIAWFGCYYERRASHGPVENWQPNIDREDQADAQRLRREHPITEPDALFGMVPEYQRVGSGGQPGWHGMLRHDGRPGGWIISEGEPGVRRLWETDSDAQLVDAWVEVVNKQARWVLETFGSRADTVEPEATDLLE